MVIGTYITIDHVDSHKDEMPIDFFSNDLNSCQKKKS